MTITFRINYRAMWGQMLCLTGTASTQEWTAKNPLIFVCEANEQWSATIELSDFSAQINYRYAVMQPDGSLNYEHGLPRTVQLGEAKNYVLRDFWRVPSDEDVFRTKAFADSLFARQEVTTPASENANVVFRLPVPRIAATQGVAVVGSTSELGGWDLSKKIPMSAAEFPLWKAPVQLVCNGAPVEYKYVIYDLQTSAVIDMEWGENRRIDWLPATGRLLCSDETFRYTQPRWKGAGVAVPIFSLRTEKGFGVGEFLDLQPLADWAAATGQKIIQTLPINDTTLLHTNKDSYPYNAVSVFALNPIFLHLEAIGTLPEARQRTRFAKRKKELNALTYVDYQTVADEKWKYIRTIFPEKSPETFASADYKTWFAANKHWLMPYAVFCYLRDLYGTPHFLAWPEHSTFKAEEVEKMASSKSAHYAEISIHYWVQYLLHKQFCEAIDYVHRRGVALKGDIPIGISPDSVDAWMTPQLFNLDAQAGAPPDDFSVSGQNWGFPTYNWDVMEQDGFAWWRQRFQQMANYFDAYRIDHILGFFRIWEMPKQDVWGLTGRFSPALPYSFDELRQKGIMLDEQRMLKPYIRPWFLQEMFGEKWEQIRDTFFEDADYELLRFRPQFDTQRKVEAYFKEHALTDEASLKVRNGLYELHCEVLFVRDLHRPELLHPRISMFNSRTYRELSQYDKDLLATLYNDFFYHRHNDFWYGSAMRKLPTIVAATNMLVCGEDLGMVPACVPEVMNRLQILSLEIQRMPKDPTVEFAHPGNAPYLSVCTTGTHDTNPLRAWWTEDRGRTQRFYNHMLGWWGDAPQECTPQIVEAIITQHIYSPAMWVILPLQDWLGISERLRLPDAQAERINVPDNPDNFWCYRMHLTVERLATDADFCQQVRGLLGQRS